MIKIVIFIYLSSLSSLGLAKNPDSLPLYDMTDLEVLLKENNYLDFFKHIEDIRPSKRDKIWGKMYQEMALVMSSDFLKNKRYTSTDYRYFEKIAQRPECKNDEIFQYKRNLYNLNYFKNATQDVAIKTDLSRSLIIKEMSNYLETSNKDPDIFYELYKINKGAHLEISSWNFVGLLVKDQISPIYCQKPEIIKEIIKKIAEVSFNREGERPYSILKELTNSKCQEIFLNKISTPELLLTFSQVEFDLGLAIIKERPQIPPSELDFLYTLFMINGPVTGSNMNLAWNRISELSESNQRRVEILKKIKELNFFPDGLFFDPNLTRSKAVITHLKKNFPEIINHYTQLCIKKIKGEKMEVKISEHNCRQFLK